MPLNGLRLADRLRWYEDRLHISPRLRWYEDRLHISPRLLTRAVVDR
jgi:hypothetical protein